MKKVVKEWNIGGHGVYTRAVEGIERNRIAVSCWSVESGECWTHVFPADFIRPLLNDPELFNSLIYPDFTFFRECVWAGIIKLIYLYHYRKVIEEIHCIVKPENKLALWYFKEGLPLDSPEFLRTILKDFEK